MYMAPDLWSSRVEYDDLAWGVDCVGLAWAVSGADLA